MGGLSCSSGLGERQASAGRFGVGRASPIKRTLRIMVIALVVLAAVGVPTAAAEGTSTGTTEITCDHITWSYTGFPNAANNMVTEIISINGVKISEEVVTFNGPEFTHTVPINAPGQKDKIDALAHWNTNGARGNFDHIGERHCEKPSFTIEKQQRIENGEGGPFTTAELIGIIGETVLYRIIVTNTGNTTLTFSNFSDPQCETIEGGPGETPVAPGESTTYTCSHKLTTKGKYVNAATVTGDPPPKTGEPKRTKSNKVVVNTLERPAYITCNKVTFYYRGFPNLENNMVTEIISVDGVKVFEDVFTFNGPSAKHTIEIKVSEGKHKIDALAHWNTNGFRGNYDAPAQVTCTGPQ
jgi:hypothetical protein